MQQRMSNTNADINLRAHDALMELKSLKKPKG